MGKSFPEEVTFAWDLNDLRGPPREDLGPMPTKSAGFWDEKAMAFRKEEGQCGWHQCKAGDEDGAEGQWCHPCDLWEKWVASNIIAKTSDPWWLVLTNLGKLGKGSAGEETAFWQVFFSAFPDHFIPSIKFKHPNPEKLAPIYKWQNLEGTLKCRAFSPS